MIEFGKSLKEAREAKGITVAQMVELTHLAPTTISELESEDFSRIAAPIYGRGFVKLYCEAVGLDPKPFVAEFMEIYSGNHDTGIKERPAPSDVQAPPPKPVETVPASVEKVPASAETEQAPAETVPASAEALSEFHLSSDVLPAAIDAAPPIIEHPTARRQGDLFYNEPEPPPTPAHAPVASATEEASHTGEHVESLAQNDHSFSRYAEPLRQLKPLVRSPIWRIAVLAGAALALVFLFVLGIRAIYRATASAPTSPAKQQTAAPASPAKQPIAKQPIAKTTAVPKPAASEKKPAAPVKTAPASQPSARTPQKIPALYVD